MTKRESRYWLCQVIGWGGWTVLYFLFIYQFAYEHYIKNSARREPFLYGLITELIFFIVVTHLLRYFLKKSNWMRYVRGRLVLVFIIGALAATSLHVWITQTIPGLMGKSLRTFEKEQAYKRALELEKELQVSGTDYYRVAQQRPADSIKKNAFDRIRRTGWSRDLSGEWKFDNKMLRANIWWGNILTAMLISLWMLIYIVWHYIERNRNDQLDRLKLETTVKELELKTIKAHINPHFIFNSLNSIRALVDENPQRARRAITELSNILRSSMHAEKMETVPLEKEMDIVKDYLALEQMRFEDRLKIEYHLDEDTLDQQVPPMMVQTLVENAIKHGIGKQMNGGVVKIYSDFVNSHYELRVQNTGTLDLNGNGSGFGLQSTQDRLKLLFGPGSSFGISQPEPNLVEVKVELPLKINMPA